MLSFARTIARRYTAPEDRPAALAALAGACHAALTGAPSGSGRQLAAARGLIGCASETPPLQSWLAGVDVPEGLAVDVELRWDLLYRLAVLGGVGEAEIAGEVARDPSAQGAEHAARCRAAIPDPAAKVRAWHTIVDDDTVSVRYMAAAASGLFHPEQAELTAPYVVRYFAEMPAMAARRTANAVQQVAMSAYPHHAVSAETLAAAQTMLARVDLDPTLRRVVTDATDDLARALAARTQAGPFGA